MGACGGKSNLSAMMVALWMDGSSDMGSIPIISIPQGTARMGGSFVLWLIYALHIPTYDAFHLQGYEGLERRKASAAC